MSEEGGRLLFAAVFLWAAAIPDLREQRIPVWIPGIFSVPAIIGASVVFSEMGRVTLWLGSTPGVFFLLLAKILRGRIGSGDGICLAVCGLMMGIFDVVEVLFWSSAAAGVVGIWLFLIKKQPGDSRLPFIPFLAGGCSVELWMVLLGRT